MVLLKEHLSTKYVERNRKWLVLFPEGGFLRKRIVKGQQYAQKNNLPILHNTTLPRLGALNGIRDILIDPTAAKVEDRKSYNSLQNTKEFDGSGACEWFCFLARDLGLNVINKFIKFSDNKSDHSVSVEPEANIEYIIDITIAYPDGGHALEIPDILTGIRPACDTHLYYRIYPINEVRVDSLPI